MLPIVKPQKNLHNKFLNTYNNRKSKERVKILNEKWQEFNQYLKNRRVAVLGVGVSNGPLLDYLYQVGANVSIFDNKEVEDLSNEVRNKMVSYSMQGFFGENSLENLKDFDLILRSPSILPTRKELIREEKRGAIVTSEIELFMKMCPCYMIGVTGSDGKTTTSTLIFKILEKAGYTCHLGGNIGTPLFTKLPQIKKEDVVVLELSSFQLMQMEVSPQTAVITNISPNHLNIHHSYEEYIDAKKQIFLHQSDDNIVVLNYDNNITRKCKDQINGKVRFFSSKTRLEDGWIVDDGKIKECHDRLRKHILHTKEVPLRGIHNYENICAALAATKDFVDPQIATKAILEFQGVEHRLEYLGQIQDVKWYNDSVSSTPTRTIAGLNSFEEQIILIAGGYDKNLDYTPLVKPVLEKVKGLILLGQTAEKILTCVTQELEKRHQSLPIFLCNSLEQTVQIAHQVAKPGQIVLFSPASASFDMFENFAQRGQLFKQLVNNLFAK